MIRDGDRQRREHDENNEREHPVSDEHHDEHCNDRPNPADGPHEKTGEEPAYTVDVGEDPRLELTRVARNEKRHRHALKVRVNLAAEPGHRALAHGRQEVTLAVGCCSLDERDTKDGQRNQLEHRDITADKDAVHDRLHQPSERPPEAPRQQGAERSSGDGPPMFYQVGFQP